MTELWKQGPAELAAIIAGKEASSAEVIDAHLARIADVNPHLNAITPRPRRRGASRRPRG